MGCRWRKSIFALCNTHRFSQTKALHKLSFSLQSIGKMLRLVLSQRTLQRFCKLPAANTILLGPKRYVEAAWATDTYEG